MTRKQPFDPTLIGDDLARRGNAVHRQMIDLDFAGLCLDAEKAWDTMQDNLATADARTGDRNGPRGSNISDPAWSQTAARAPHLDQIASTIHEMIEALGHIRIAKRTLDRVTREANAWELEQALQAERCTVKPERSMEPWVHVDCRRNAVSKDPTFGQLCDPCKQRMEAWEQAVAEGRPYHPRPNRRAAA